MKTKIIKHLSISALFILSLISLSSCEITYYGSNTDLLCGTTWVDSWEGDYGRYYEQRFVFYSGGRGVEYYFDGIERVYDFYWHWEDNERTIVMAYGPSDVSYFDDIYIGRGTLSGYLNGDYVEFRAW